jgi:DinB family protein
MKIGSLVVATALMCAGNPSLCVAQSGGPRTPRPSAVARATMSDSAPLAQDRANFRLMMTSAVRRNIVSAAEAMPADKYGFAPTVGEFQNVRTFSRQIRHLAATNFILSAAALGQSPPADAGDEEGPDSVVTKAQHLVYLNRSFDALEKAIDAIGDSRIGVRSSPISPFQGNTATRISLVSEALTHAYDHYGQMVVYLRMNGIIPPASRR